MAQEERATEESHGTQMTAAAVYQAIRHDGDGELSRPLDSLWWSGVAAGILISASVLAKGLLHYELPDNDWRPALENVGYCFGFLIVVLGRMQLFTENTITAILPLAANKSARALWRTVRLWVIVLVANMVGAMIAATVIHYGMVSPGQLHAIEAISAKLFAKTWLEMFLHAIPAGLLIAAMVWMLPNSRGFEIWVIVFLTYLIAIGAFAHVVVGAVEGSLLWLGGQLGALQLVWGFLVPALLGNIVGGTVLFSLLAYGQVRQEIE